MLEADIAKNSIVGIGFISFLPRSLLLALGDLKLFPEINIQPPGASPPVSPRRLAQDVKK
jgi:hypothetical protein